MSRLRPDRIVRMAGNGYVPLTDAARAAGYNEVTLRRLFESQRIKGVQFGTRHFVQWESLLDYVGREAAALAGLPTSCTEVIKLAERARRA